MTQSGLARHFALNLRIAIDAVLGNKLRSLLTALGIIFGVAAVIAMLGIGEGARQEISNQIKLVGVNNILIEPIVPTAENEDKIIRPHIKKQFSPGLSIDDLDGIEEIIPSVKEVSLEIRINSDIFYSGTKGSCQLFGVLPVHFKIYNLTLSEGAMFTPDQVENGLPVCIINQSAKSRFLPTENPIGKSIKVGVHWMSIVGVLPDQPFNTDKGKDQNTALSKIEIYCPLQTMLVRYENRQLIKESDLLKAAIRNRGIKLGGTQDNSEQSTGRNYHQLDRVVIHVKETDELETTAEIISRMLIRKHFGSSDFRITIPELLLKQQQRTTEVFNYVLGAIASISLLVGGIGIMNIMLASVLERLKEIGIRLTVGARKSDIVAQFLMEAILICITAGMVGVGLGIVLTVFVTYFADIPAAVSFGSILISFSIAALIGLLFGVTPAFKAAQQDPVSSLRNE
jgi:putative ABC transport system permease protein